MNTGKVSGKKNEGAMRHVFIFRPKGETFRRVTVILRVVDHLKGETVKRGWDLGLDYETVLRKLKRAYEEAKTPRERGAIAALLVQLTNGCRVSEALEALRLFVETRKREVRVRVRKRKDAERLIIIPSIVSSTSIIVPTKRLVQYKAKRLGFNTHSLRYAFITYMAKRGVAPQMIARITGHAKLDYIVYYTQQVAAEELLREVVK